MLKTIQKFFNSQLSIHAGDSAEKTEHALRLATAALLIEITRADYEIKDIELKRVLELLQQRFDLDQNETSELMRLASEEADNSTSYHEFTSLINAEYSLPQKIQVIELLWEIAYADQHIEKYEDFLVRKIAELLYVPHQDFIAAKHRVIERR